MGDQPAVPRRSPPIHPISPISQAPWLQDGKKMKKRKHRSPHIHPSSSHPCTHHPRTILGASGSQAHRSAARSTGWWVSHHHSLAPSKSLGSMEFQISQHLPMYTSGFFGWRAKFLFFLVQFTQHVPSKSHVQIPTIWGLNSSQSIFLMAADWAIQAVQYFQRTRPSEPGWWEHQVRPGWISWMRFGWNVRKLGWNQQSMFLGDLDGFSDIHIFLGVMFFVISRIARNTQMVVRLKLRINQLRICPDLDTRQQQWRRCRYQIQKSCPQLCIDNNSSNTQHCLGFTWFNHTVQYVRICYRSYIDWISDIWVIWVICATNWTHWYGRTAAMLTHSITGTGPSDGHLGLEVLGQDPEDEAQVWTGWPRGKKIGDLDLKKRSHNWSTYISTS